MFILKNKFFLTVIILFFVFYLFTPFSASAKIPVYPFGGVIIKVTTCNVGLLVDVVGPKGGRFIWQPSTFSFLYGPPIKIGQFVLGMAGPLKPCIVSGDIIGLGLYIFYHGSSLPF